MYKVKEYSGDAKGWDSILKSRGGSFLQSWAWGGFQESIDKKIYRLAIYNGEVLENVCLIIQMKLPFGFYWLYCPHWLPSTKNSIESVINFINVSVKDASTLFFKTDPLLEDSNILNESILKSVDEIIQPPDTLILDLLISEEQLLLNMHKKTRYNIRLSQKKGVTISWSKKNIDIKGFLGLVGQTSSRQGLISHSDLYYQNMLKQDNMYLQIAYIDGKAIASNIISIYGGRATYVHGASDYDYRKLMAPHLLQWNAIKYAKDQGCTQYDFWGVEGDRPQTKKWAGFTRFKVGFCPEIDITKYIGLYSLVYHPIIYFFYKILRRFR